MDKLALVLMLAVTAEALVEYGKEPRGGVWRRGLQSGGAAAVRGGGRGAAVRAVGRGHVRGARRAVQLAGGGDGAHRDFLRAEARISSVT